MAHIIKSNYIFPTVVYEFVYKANDQLKDIIKNEPLNINTNGFGNFSFSKDINLHNKKEYRTLANKILETSQEVCDICEYEYTSIEITNMWLNVSKDQTYHSPHTHSNNNFSGVWYPLEFEEIPLTFIDPRPQNNMWSPRKKNPNVLTASQIAFSNKKDSGFIFPAWLKHYVPASNSRRMSLSWNILVRGQYGEPNTLQNANI
mgnify:CR=1 FL=1|tara:strand:+ start:278 stop:886 length:609 start_codon:yes stop_codon:yes gene_type:complete